MLFRRPTGPTTTCCAMFVWVNQAKMEISRVSCNRGKPSVAEAEFPLTGRPRFGTDFPAFRHQSWSKSFSSLNPCSPRSLIRSRARSCVSGVPFARTCVRNGQPRLPPHKERLLAARVDLDVSPREARVAAQVERFARWIFWMTLVVTGATVINVCSAGFRIAPFLARRRS